MGENSDLEEGEMNCSSSNEDVLDLDIDLSYIVSLLFCINVLFVVL